MEDIIAIIRTSTERQEIETQRKELLEFIKNDGIDESRVRVIGEAGASAIKLDDEYRRNIEKVYEAVDGGGIKCVYAWALDRIGRNEQVMFGFKQYLIDHKVNLKIVNPSLVLLNADGSVNSGMEIAFSLYVTMAKQEMEQKQARFKRGKKRNVEQGRFNGGPRPLFGYKKNENGYVVPDPIESEIVITMFTLYSTGRYSGKALSDEIFERYGRRIGQEVVAEEPDVLRQDRREICLGQEIPGHNIRGAVPEMQGGSESEPHNGQVEQGQPLRRPDKMPEMRKKVLLQFQPLQMLWPYGPFMRQSRGD